MNKILIYVDQKLKILKQCGNVIESLYFLEMQLNLWKILLDGPSPTCEVHTYKNGIQVPLYLANILSLSHLQCKENKRK